MALRRQAMGRPEPRGDPGQVRDRRYHRNIGTACVHAVIDDHSRVAFAKILEEETAAGAVAVLKRAVSWFAARCVTVERVLSDNGSAYKFHLWRDTCRKLIAR